MTAATPLRPAAGATNPTRSRPAAQIAAVLRSEWIKATTVRTNKIILAVMAIVGLPITWATAEMSTDEVLTLTDVFVHPIAPAAVLAAIAGVLLFTADVQHGTLAASLTAHPSRWPVVAAKTTLAAGFGLLLGVVGLTIGCLGALLGGIEVGDTSGLLTSALWALLYTSGSALFGLGIGMIVRHSAGAVAGVLVWWLVVEALVVEFAPATVVRFLPFDAGFRTLGVETELDSPEIVAYALSNPLHATIFWGYVLAALILGATLLLRRDAD